MTRPAPPRDFLTGVAADFEAAARDPEVWSADQVQRESWDATVADGLSVSRPPHTTPAERAAPRRGDVWLVDVNPTNGGPQVGVRAALVLSVDALNASKADLVVVTPITSLERSIRTRVEVVAPEGGLSATGWVICEQLRTVSRERLVERLGEVTAATLAKVDANVAALLGLGAAP